MVSRTLLAATLAAAALLSWTPAPTARADEGPDSSAVFQERLARLLDRWNDDAPKNRIEKAIELCEKQIKEKPDDAQAQLELARFKLAKDDPEAAVIAAIRADDLAAGQPERQRQAKALHLVAFSIASTARPQAQTQEDADKYQRRFVELYKKLEAAAGSKDAADALIMAEREKLDHASTLNEIGKVRTVDVTFSDGKTVERRDTEGKPVKLDSYNGKVVIVDFWSAAYEPYQREIANTVALREKYKDKLEVVGISLDKDRAALDAFVKANNVPWRQIFSGKGLADDTVVSWAVPGVRRFLIDHEGKVRFVNVRGDGLAAAVKQLVERAEKTGKK